MTINEISLQGKVKFLTGGNGAVLRAHEPHGRSGAIPEPTVRKRKSSPIVWMKEESRSAFASRVLKKEVAFCFLLKTADI